MFGQQFSSSVWICVGNWKAKDRSERYTRVEGVEALQAIYGATTLTKGGSGKWSNYDYVLVPGTVRVQARKW